MKDSSGAKKRHRNDSMDGVLGGGAGGFAARPSPFVPQSLYSLSFRASPQDCCEESQIENQEPLSRTQVINERFLWREKAPSE